MELREKQEYQEEATSEKDIGTVLITIGGILLLFEVGLLLFVGRDIREGLHFFSTWMITQAALGVLLIIVGFVKKSKTHVKDDA